MAATLSRRTLLKTTGALTLAAALGTALAGRADWAAAIPRTGLTALRERWVDQITGRTLIDTADRDFTRAIATLDGAVTATVADLAAGNARTTVFTDAAFDDSANVVTTYKRLAQMAIAWATPGSTYHQDTSLLAHITAGLADTYRLIYNPQQAEFGNWWSWEIGSTKALADTMAILADHLDPQQIADYAAAIDHFVPDPYYQFPDSRGRQVSEGANRVDLCQAVIIRAIVGGDPDRLSHAISGLDPTWAYVDTGNGLYRDGSFIQHSTIPYTGTYGVVLLSGLSSLFALLSGSDAEITEPSRSNVFDAVEQTFAPFVYDEQMMDCVRGRAISREQERSHDDGHVTVQAILTLADSVPAQTGNRWRGLCRGWIERNHYDSILTGASVVRTALVKSLLASAVPARPETSGPQLFADMDRVVYRGHGWAVALAMCSRRITWYECGNGENNKGYHSGSGMTYVYTGADGHFDDAFLPTVDLNRLPGITVDTTPLPDKVEGEWGANTPDNLWAGGVALGSYAMIGQHLIGPGGTGLSGRKSWFLTEDMVVCLGAGISTGTAAPVETIVEQRNLGATGTSRLVVDGRLFRPVDQLSSIDGARWAALEGVGGYVFLDRSGLRALQERRTGNWRQINVNGSPQELTRRYVTLLVDHGRHPINGSYGYVLLPGMTAADTARWAHRPQADVVANTEHVQAVDTGRVSAACFWQPGRAGRWRAETPAAVIAERSGNRVRIAVADPTHAQDSVIVGFTTGSRWRLRPRHGVAARRRGETTLLTVDTNGRAGAPVEVILDV
jgi:hyaluronate lyase